MSRFIDCPTCQGSGVCQRCMGDGTRYAPHSNIFKSNYVRCELCTHLNDQSEGDGKCNRCDGSGEIEINVKKNR
jgi:hypothetical protein